MIPQSLRELLADVFEIAPEQVTPDLSAGSIEKWDSFGHLQAILALESEYGIQFDPQKIPNLTSVAALHSELEAKGVHFD
jgi:acyl carrier protein